MRFLHISDLHLGKRLCAFGMEDDQSFILGEIVRAAAEEGVDAVLIAGDVFDRLNPPAQAVALLDEFLTRLREAGIEVFAVAGNHDAPERLDYAARLLDRQGVHIAGTFRETAPCVRLEDGHGPLNVWLLPYVRPGNVRDVWPGCRTLTEGIRTALAGVDPAVRNVLVTHQLALPASALADCAEPDAVDAALFSGFDYAALGHLHSPMSVGRPETRYAGSPLAYSTADAGRTKTLTLAELGPKGSVKLRELPLCPLRPLRRLEGELDEVLRDNPPSEDYLHVRLTNRDPVLDAMKRLRARFPNLLRLEWTARSAPAQTEVSALPRREPLELYGEFFRLMNGRELTENELCLLREAGEEALL